MCCDHSQGFLCLILGFRVRGYTRAASSGEEEGYKKRATLSEESADVVVVGVVVGCCFMVSFVLF